MLDGLISQLIGALKSQILPPVQRYFTYIFILIGIVWLVGANYYYVVSEVDKSIGSLLSGVIFLVMALITYLWENYITKKVMTNNNSLSELLIKASPFLAPIAFNGVKNVVFNRKIFKLLAIGAAAYVSGKFLLGGKRKG
ncbi:MAG: hypothetical protein ACRYE9_00730 [Janthinobacterium lividum]